VKRVAQKWALLYFSKCARNKQWPKGRKFAQSGHPREKVALMIGVSISFAIKGQVLYVCSLLAYLPKG
jgi:hypothetical protein